MHLFFTLAAGILGLIVGSFLNVVIYRMNTGKGVGGRSQCLSCRKVLSWHELIPILSFAWQRGRCRSCRTPLSFQYPLVELVTGVGFALVAHTFFWILFVNRMVYIGTLVFWLVFFCLAVVISVYDMRHKIIPLAGLIPLVILVVIGALFGGFLGGSFILAGWKGVSLAPLFSLFLVSAPFAFLWMYSDGRWIGFGDIEIMMLIGLFLGIIPGFSAIVLAFWSGAILLISLWIGMRLRKDKHSSMSQHMNHAIPFAPFLLFGIFLVGVFGLNVFAILGGI